MIAVAVDPVAAELVELEASLDVDRAAAAAVLFAAWHELLVTADLLGGWWVRLRERLAAVVASSQVRPYLTGGQRHLIDTYGPKVPRCRCGVELVAGWERERGFCVDCGLEFEADVENEEDEDDVDD